MTAHVPVYGKLKAEGDRWILTDIPPHVAIKFKSVFPRVPKTQTKTFSLPLNQETCADLKWFESRYHMSMSGADRALLERGTRLFEEDRAAAQAIMLPDWKPPERHGFRPGRQAYRYQVQASELALRRKALLIGDDVGMGKEQPLTAKILTPSGWTTMGRIHVGAKVIGQSGDTRTVTAVHPQGVKPVYRVTFSDGAVVECGLEHQWIVRDSNRRLRDTGWVVRSLSLQLERGLRLRSGAPQWEIPLATATAFDGQSPLPVDPYL